MIEKIVDAIIRKQRVGYIKFKFHTIRKSCYLWVTCSPHANYYKLRSLNMACVAFNIPMTIP